MNFDHVVVWWGYTQITGTSCGRCAQIAWTSHWGCAQIKWTSHGGRAPIRWTHNGTCSHIPYIRSLPTEQSVRLFPCGLILRRFCTNRKTRKSFAAEEVIVMNMTNRENYADDTPQQHQRAEQNSNLVAVGFTPTLCRGHSTGCAGMLCSFKYCAVASVAYKVNPSWRSLLAVGRNFGCKDCCSENKERSTKVLLKILHNRASS